MNYWDKGKTQRTHYEPDMLKKTPPQERDLQRKEEFILVLMWLKQGLGILQMFLLSLWAL